MVDKKVYLNLYLLISNWSEQIRFVNYATMNILPFFWEGRIYVNGTYFAFLRYMYMKKHLLKLLFILHCHSL